MIPSKQEPRYRTDAFPGALWRITFEGQAFEPSNAIPAPKGSNLVNIQRTVGRRGQPETLTLSRYAFEQHFTEVDLLSDDTDEATEPPVKL